MCEVRLLAVQVPMSLEEQLGLLAPWQTRRLVLMVRDQLAGLMGRSEEAADSVILVQLDILRHETGDPYRSNPDRPPCTAAEGCERPAYCHGLCTMHYARLRRHGNTERLRTASYEGQLCEIPGCDALARSRGMCYLHYKQWQKLTQKD